MSERFDAVDVIVAKRDGHRLSDAQIDWVVDAYTRGVVADEQMSALAMAILLNGMTREEIARWTETLGVNHFSMRVQWPGLEQEKVLGSIRRLGEIFG